MQLWELIVLAKMKKKNLNTIMLPILKTKVLVNTKLQEN